MKDVIAGQFLGGGGVHHLLATNDANIISALQFLWSGFRVPSVHIVDSSSGQDHIVKSFLECSRRQVHGSNSEQWQGVDAYHNDDKESVEDDFK